MNHATMSQAFTLRAYRRVRTRCAVEYSINGRTGTGIMHDASLTGYRVVGDRYVVKGDTMSLRVYLPPFLIAIEITSARVQGSKVVNSGCTRSHQPPRAKPQSTRSSPRLPKRDTPEVGSYSARPIQKPWGRSSPREVPADDYHQRGNPFRSVGEATQTLRLHIGTEQWRHPQ